MEETKDTEVTSCFTFYCWSVSFEWHLSFKWSWISDVCFFSCDSKIFIWRPPFQLISYTYRKWVGGSTGDGKKQEKKRNKERDIERLRLIHEQRKKKSSPSYSSWWRWWWWWYRRWWWGWQRGWWRWWCSVVDHQTPELERLYTIYTYLIYHIHYSWKFAPISTSIAPIASLYIHGYECFY